MEIIQLSESVDRGDALMAELVMALLGGADRFWTMGRILSRTIF